MILDSAKYHSILADFFLRTSFSRRKVKELPWQLMVSGDFERLYTLYSDLPFFHLAWKTDRHETKEFWKYLENKSSNTPSLAYESLIKSPTDDQISYCEDISEFFLDRFQAKDAIPVLEFQVQYYRRKDYKYHLLRSIANYATALVESGMHGPAMKWYQEQEKTARESGHQSEYQAALGNQASILILQSKFDQSIELLDRQEKLLRSLNSRFNLAICLNNQAVVNRYLGEPKRAGECLDEALKTACEIDRELSEVCGLNQSMLLYDAGNYDDAEVKLRSALEEFNRIGNTRYIHAAMNNLAAARMQKGDIAEASAILDKLEESCLRNNDQITSQACFFNKALIFIEQGETEIASDLLFKTEKTARKLEIVEGICRSFVGYAILSVIKTGEHRKAGILLNEAGELAAHSRLALLQKEIERLKNKLDELGISSTMSLGWIIPILPASRINFSVKSIEADVKSELIVPDWSLLGEEEILSFIDNGGNPSSRDKDGGTALMSAVSMRSEELTSLLISLKVYVNACDTNGTTALMIASNKGDTQVMKQLLHAGANVNQSKEDGFTPLLFAVQSGKADAVRLLLEKGADPDKPAINGLAPVHLAAWKCSKEILAELISYGADPSKKMDDGSTAYDLTRDRCPDLFNDIRI